jgi:hypothetical protein
VTIPVDFINAHRLREWQHVLSENNATPLLLIGVGHDERSGEFHLLVPDGVSRDSVMAVLTTVLEALSHRHSTEMPADGENVLIPFVGES